MSLHAITYQEIDLVLIINMIRPYIGDQTKLTSMTEELTKKLKNYKYYNLKKA